MTICRITRLSSATRIFTGTPTLDRKSTRLNSSHTEIYTLSLHDALPIYDLVVVVTGLAERADDDLPHHAAVVGDEDLHRDTYFRSEEHTSELQSHRDLHSFPTRRSSDLRSRGRRNRPGGACG